MLYKKRKSCVIDECIGKNLYNARIARNLTLDELGKEVGVCREQIRKYERGIDRISASLLFIFTKKLNVNINFFY